MESITTVHGKHHDQVLKLGVGKRLIDDGKLVSSNPSNVVHQLTSDAKVTHSTVFSKPGSGFHQDIKLIERRVQGDRGSSVSLGERVSFRLSNDDLSVTKTRIQFDMAQATTGAANAYVQPLPELFDRIEVYISGSLMYTVYPETMMMVLKTQSTTEELALLNATDGGANLDNGLDIKVGDWTAATLDFTRFMPWSNGAFPCNNHVYKQSGLEVVFYFKNKDYCFDSGGTAITAGLEITNLYVYSLNLEDKSKKTLETFQQALRMHQHESYLVPFFQQKIEVMSSGTSINSSLNFITNNHTKRIFFCVVDANSFTTLNYNTSGDLNDLGTGFHIYDPNENGKVYPNTLEDETSLTNRQIKRLQSSNGKIPIGSEYVFVISFETNVSESHHSIGVRRMNLNRDAWLSLTTTIGGSDRLYIASMGTAVISIDPNGEATINESTG